MDRRAGRAVSNQWVGGQCREGQHLTAMEHSAVSAESTGEESLE
jgi:hypothetical protein